MSAVGTGNGGFAPDAIYDPEDRPRRKRRGGCLVGVVATLVILALVITGGYLLALQQAYNSNVTHFSGEDQSFPPEEDRPEATNATNILLLGSDAEGGSGDDEDLPRVPGGGRSDTMMLVHIPSTNDSVQVLSIPRDLWVEIPYDHGWHKVNAGLALGGGEGPWLTVATVEQLMDVRVDHVAAIDMLGFVGLVDSMGSVTVDSGYSETFTASGGHTFEPGPQEMNAEQALSFVRHRSSFPDGDLQRIRNQQAFIQGVINDAATPSTLANPLRVRDMVASFSAHLISDPDLSATSAASIVWQARGAQNSIDFATLPNGGSGYSDDGQWVFYQDEAAIEEISDAMREDRLKEHLEGSGEAAAD